jgi:transposase
MEACIAAPSAVACGVPAEAWEGLPEAARTLFAVQGAYYENLLEEQRRTYEVRLHVYEERIHTLEARLNQNSSNSSKPPSSDPPWNKKPSVKPPSGKPRGGQPGHVGQCRSMAPPEKVVVVDHVPERCTCGETLRPEDEVDAPSLRQIWELPEVQAIVTQHQLHRRRCGKCKRVNTAEPPPDVPTGAFGPNFQANIALLTGRYRLSRREAQAYSQEVWDVPISQRSIQRIEHDMALGLEAGYNEAWDAVKAASVRNVDETGFRQSGKKGWLWVAVAPKAKATAFKLAARRKKAVFEERFGDAVKVGHYGSDRYAAYSFIEPKRRQLCHAHLKRDFKKISERSGYTILGNGLLVWQKSMFDQWHCFKSGEIDRCELQKNLEPIKAPFIALLESGKEAPDKKVAGMCKHIWNLRDALWNFASVPDLEPTNNSAERALRKAVLWRKGSFGTQSSEGSVYVERILTATETCRQNERSVIGFFRQVAQAIVQCIVPPRLIPDPGGGTA